MADETIAAVKRLEIKRYGYNLTFLMAEDESECNCSYVPAIGVGTPLTAAELQTHLTQLKISDGIYSEAMADLLNAAASGQSITDLPFAKGSAMIPGKAGVLLIDVPDDLATPEPLVPENEAASKIDFRRVQSFLNVGSGDLIATIHPPGEGVAGKTVTGKIIPAQAGNPADFQIGQNVRISDDSQQLFAEAVGRVCQQGTTISVEEIYEVDGDVGFKIGNIVFNGYVVIKGDVLDDFSVKAHKGIKITGNIGICTIESDGDISFCGMNGQEKGKIICAGSITANFIYEAAVECSGDIIVETEIRSSHIKCLGSISVNKGGIVGGEYFALAGIQTASLGCVTSLHTRVVTGVHYRDLEELNSLFNELKTLVSEFSAAPKGSIDMKDFAKRRASITEKTHEVRSRIYESSNAKLNVTKKLFEGVAITLGMVSDNIKEERKGPMSIIENTLDGGLRFLGMTNLTFKAETIEQTFIQQRQLELQKNQNENSGE